MRSGGRCAATRLAAGGKVTFTQPHSFSIEKHHGQGHVQGATHMTSPPTAIRGGGLADEPELEAETSLGQRNRGRAAGVRRPGPLTIVHELLPLQKRRTVPERAVAGAQHAVDSTVAELAALASGQKAPVPAKAAALRRQLVKVRKTPSWPRSWANFRLL